MNGAYTLWVRRGLIYNADGTIRDDTNDSLLVLTAEGIAPYTDAQLSSTIGRRNAAVRTLEVTLVRAASGSDTCESYRGQAGGGVSGSGFWNCAVLGDTCAASNEALSRGMGSSRRTTTTDISGNQVGSGAAGTLCDTGVR